MPHHRRTGSVIAHRPRTTRLAVVPREAHVPRMDKTVTEIAPDVYRLSTWTPSYGIQFNEF